MRVPILDRLARGDVLIADGATGTMLLAAGLPAGKPGEAWVLERPEQIGALHLAYLQAGSEMILTTTFGGTRARLRFAGLEADAPDVNRRAAQLAREAAGEDRYVGGDVGPTGELLAPIGKLTYDVALEMFAEQVQGLADGGVDVIYIETMSDLNEARAAVEAAHRVCSLPVFCTFSFDHRGRTAMGVTPTLAAQTMAGMRVQAVGANCGHAPEELLDLLPQMCASAPDAFLIAKPNAGVPRLINRQAVYDATPERMAELAKCYADLGARVLGTCCGSSPDHIAAIARAFRLPASEGREG